MAGLCALLLAVLAGPSPAALAPGHGLASFHHSRWLIKDGAPADVWALAQAPDGYLWLGTGMGLYRFDGVRFVRHRPTLDNAFASNNITALEIVSKDEIWVGYHAAGISALRGRAITNYGTEQGVPPGMVFAFAQQAGGRLWAATGGGLAYYDQGRWQPAHADSGWNYPWKRAEWVLCDREGTLWVATGDSVAFLRAGASAFVHTGLRTSEDAVLAQAPDGRLWISDALSGTRPLVLPGETAPPSASALTAVSAKRLLFLQDGSLWGSDARRGGIFHVAEPDRPEAGIDRFGKTQGLTADVAVPLVEDSEGNVWVGSNLGLNRFRHRNVMALEAVTDTASGFAVATGPGDQVIVASGGRLLLTDGDHSRVIGPAPPVVLSAYTGPDARLWLISPAALSRLEGGRLQDVPLPAGQSGRNIGAVLGDADGTLWVSLVGDGVYGYRDGHWRRDARLSTPRPEVMARADDGGFWLGYPRGHIARVDAQGRQDFGPEQGLAIGNITAISAGPRQLLVAGEFGLARLVGDRFQSLGQDRDDAFGNITGILETDDGELWLNGSKGVLRLSSVELQRSLADPLHHPEYTLFSQQDGLPGIALQAKPMPTAIAGGNGRLWFATNQGIAWIDPARVRRNTRPPQVSILALTAGETSYAPSAALRLPPLTTNLSIDYTATSLTEPERVRFRYRLEGADVQWQDAGNRRQAYYTHLGPGDYRFRVIAANNDGIWSEVAAGLDFTIAPTFLQTPWFVGLCVLVILGLLYLMYLFRLRQLGLHIRTRLHERHMERERIARELHDTLLQSIQGLILRFQAVSESIPPQQPARIAMESALERADAVLAEGRDRVLDLRAASSPNGDLGEALAGVARELAQGDPAVFSLQVEGEPKPLDPIVLDELFRIGREALLNAYQHADARAIAVELRHGYDEVRLRISDDGRGIDPKVLGAGGRPGHWGLRGMRERAGRINAQLNFWSRPGAGTEIEIKMPAEAAYRPCLKASRRRWLARLFGRRG